MRIGKLARACDCPVETVRYYEKIGLLPPPARLACSEVHDLLEQHVHDVRRKVDELQRLERALVRLKKQCHEGTLHDCPVIDELMSQ